LPAAVPTILSRPYTTWFYADRNFTRYVICKELKSKDVGQPSKAQSFNGFLLKLVNLFQRSNQDTNERARARARTHARTHA